MSSRRDFIRKSGALAVACCGLGSISHFLQSCAPYKMVVLEPNDNKLSISQVNFDDGKNFLIVKAPSAGLPANIYLSRQAGRTYKALLMLCTHKQCDLSPTGNTLTCYCHGSEFSSQGKVLKSPAAQELKSYRVTADAENIYIHLK